MENTLVLHRNTKLLFSNRSATRSKLKGLMLVLGFAAVFGCQMLQDASVLDELIGEWVTTERRYRDCSFEIQKETIIFNKGITHTDMNWIEKIACTRTALWALNTAAEVAKQLASFSPEEERYRFERSANNFRTISEKDYLAAIEQWSKVCHLLDSGPT